MTSQIDYKEDHCVAKDPYMPSNFQENWCKHRVRCAEHDEYKLKNLAQDKAKLQRQYRAKEANAFAELQKLLRDTSQGTDVPQTRLEIIVQAIETIKYLDHRNTMLQGLREPPLPVPVHSAMKFNSHLVQNPSTEWHSFHNDLVDERHRLTGMMQYAPVVDSSGMWNPPVPSNMPSVLPGRSFQAGVGASGDGSFHYC